MAGALLLQVLIYLLVVALSAAQAPVLLEEPTDTVAIPVGHLRSATLSCRALSYTNPSVIEWYKDDEPVEMTLLPNYTIINTSLIVATTDPRDDGIVLEGMYYCVIRNAFGAVRSRSALVRTQRAVASAQPNTAVVYPEETVVLGEILYIEKPLLAWTINCNRSTYVCSTVSCPLYRIASIGRLLIFFVLRFTYTDISLLIPSCTKNDTITVSVPTSPDGQIRRIHFSGTLFMPRNPLKNLGTLHVSVEVGDNATLYCVSNHPNATYTWKHDGSPIQVVDHSRYSFLIDGVLQIQDVVQTDGGLYVCSATALYPMFGQQTRKTEVRLTVYSLSKLNLSLIIQDGNSTTNCDSLNTTEECRVYSVVSSLTAVCQFDGSVPLLVKILHNAATVFQQNVTDHQRSLQHNFSNPVSSGIYQCIVTNPYGSTQTSVYAHVPDSSQV
jgi:hypothetical protein